MSLSIGYYSRVFYSPLESAHLNQTLPVSTNTQSVQPLQTSTSNVTSLMNGDEKRPLNHIQTYRYVLLSLLLLSGNIGNEATIDIFPF